ncbi:hypothetical protein [Leptospira idonii]|uniref:Lipoprotein n=1 Tax=Leptospira idonii TaxID=1193500 RepID=A0A4R9LXB0_9LEPT|nr:hypothetical protein [Leptospira idonii]TGN18944.1 hypothetical protein EHS15_11035 [Leptospira idonii]
MKFLKFNLFLFLSVLLLEQCAAFVKDPDLQFQKGKLPGTVPIRIVFTGFARYEKEKQSLKQSILKSGFSEDTKSDLLLEVVLEEINPEYESIGLHRLNILATVFSAGIFPYQINTNHLLSFRYSDSEKNIRESEFKTTLSQWRGFSMIFFSPFYWPSSSFGTLLLQTWSEEVKYL